MLFFFSLLHNSVKWNCDVLLQEMFFLLQSLNKGVMSANGSSLNLILVVHCMLFFIVILLYSGLKTKKTTKKQEGAISYFTFETKVVL